MHTSEIISLGEQYLMRTYARFPVAFVRGEGCYLWDADGKRYLDLLSGIAVNALGYAHPAITEAAHAQMQKIIHSSNLFHIQPQAELAQILCENSFADRAFFCNSGAEANEAAIKLARRAGKLSHGEHCYEVISAERSFHGRTLRTMAATGQARIKQGFEPLPEGFTHVPFNDIEALRAAVSAKTCSILLEPVQGEGGIRFAETEYLKAVRQLCDERGILLIFDEIQTGMGRTGHAFAYEHSGIAPDILSLAKGLGAGVPIGACLATEKVASAFVPGDHGSTFGGNFLSCAVAKRFMEILLSSGFLENIRAVGEYFLTQLQALPSKHAWIREVRGLGLMLGVELDIPGKPLVEAALQRGLVINCVQERTLRLVPPLILSMAQVDEAMDMIQATFQEANI